MQSPKYVIPASAFAFVAYPEKRAVGFQFQVPNGEHTLVALVARFLTPAIFTARCMARCAVLGDMYRPRRSA